MITNKVLIVLNNYSRPKNMPKLIKAWREQSVQGNHIVVVDNRPIEKYKELNDDCECYPSDGLEQADDIWRWKINSGCPCHFYPALAYPQFAYTIFADDDLIPGNRVVENLLECANKLENKFATIGQIGRRFALEASPGQRYTTCNQPQRRFDSLITVNLTCRVHMIITYTLPFILSFRNQLAAHSEEGLRLAHTHDDFIMCMGAQKSTKFPSYLIPLGGKEFELVKYDLDDKEALWRKPGHFSDRNRMVDLSLELGWKPTPTHTISNHQESAKV